MLNVAKPLVEHGFAVHWLKPKSKAPAMGKEWAQLPVATWGQLKARYREGMNIGVRLGEPSIVGGYYLHVLDLDIRDEEYLDEAMAALAELFPDYESFPRVASGSGGASRHFYFLSDKPFRSRKLAHSSGKYTDAKNVRHWFWEIELFGTGKQVAMPPSIHPDTGKAYRWEQPFDFDLVEMGFGPFVPFSDMPDGVAVGEVGDAPEDEDEELAALLALVNSPPRGLTIDEIRDVLDSLPAEEWCEDRDGWFRAGMAVHHELKGSDEGFELWCEWSEQSAKFDEEDARRVWASFHDPAKLPRDVKPLTMSSLLKVVQDEGLDFIQCQNRLQQAQKYREALRIASAYDLSETEADTILPRLLELAKLEGRVAAKASVRKDLKAARKEYKRENEIIQRKGLEEWIADEVMRIFFAGGKHLKRLAKGFWFYDKGVWRMIESEVVGNRVYQVVSRLTSSTEEGAKALQILLAESGRNDTTNALCNSVLGILEKKCASDSSEDPLGLCREDPGSVMNCKNGELWFSEGDFDFLDHDPEHLLTQQINANFDQDAECPEWDAALRRVFRENDDVEDIIRHLEEVMAYTLQPTRNLAAWVMFYGKGSNGKSMVAQVLQSIMGPRSCASMSLTEFQDGRKGAHAEAGLVGKLLLLDDDFKHGASLPDDVLKKISETKQLTANPKYGGTFNFMCRCTPMILTNHWPRTSDLSWGLVRRAKVFHFNSTITDEEADETLLGRILANERDAIFTRLVDAWARLQARGHFLVPVSCQVALDEWLGNRNSLATFIRDCILITGNPEDCVPAQEVYDTYRLWSRQEGLDNHFGRNTLYEQLANMEGIEKTKRNKGQVFLGLQILPPDDELEQMFEDLDDVEGMI